MKFKIDIKALQKAIMPILEATGAAEKKHDINDYLQVSGKTINLCQEATETAIKSVLTNTNKELPDKEINRCCADACVAIGKKLFPLKRITITANKDKLVALASEGNITAKVTISAKDFEGIGYECQQQGQLTLEPYYLKALLKNTANWGTVEVVDADNNTVKVYPESEDGGIRQFFVFSYHVKAKIPGKAKKIGVIDKSILIRSFKAVHSAIDKKSRFENLNRILVRFSKNKIQSLAGDGALFASYAVDGVSVRFNESIEVMLSGDDIDSIINSLRALRDDKVVIKFKEDKGADYLIFVQGKTQISVCCHYSADKYSSGAHIFGYDYKYAFRTKLSDWFSYVGKTITPVSKAYPIVKIEADIEKGHFLVEHSRKDFRCQTPIRFIYGSNVEYYNPAKIKEGELQMTCFTKHIVMMIENGTLEDVISIEFGMNDSPPDSSHAKNEIQKNLLLIRYPVRQVKKTGTNEQFILLLAKNVKFTESP